MQHSLNQMENIIEWRDITKMSVLFVSIFQRRHSHDIAEEPGKIIWIVDPYFVCDFFNLQCSKVQILAGLLNFDVIKIFKRWVACFLFKQCSIVRWWNMCLVCQFAERKGLIKTLLHKLYRKINSIFFIFFAVRRNKNIVKAKRGKKIPKAGINVP